MSVILQIFSESELQTLKLIAGYLRERGQRCFTYRGLRGYYDRLRVYRRLEWHTVERNIRRLAQYNWLTRIQKRYRDERGWHNLVIFCLTENLEDELRKLGWL